MQPEGLAEALASDLPASFEQLVVAYQDRLYSFGLHLTGRTWDAEEIAQEAFIRAYHALERYPDERIQTLKLRPWLYQIALNVFRNRIRGPSPELVSFGPYEEGGVPEPVDGGGCDPEKVAEQRETREALRALIAGLPERYRIAVVLRHVEGLDYSEIARLLGQPVGTAKANVHRGVRLLRQALEAEPERAEAIGRGEER